ncbi:MAG: hypothetical protein ABIK68_17545 [bacterium]
MRDGITFMIVLMVFSLGACTTTKSSVGRNPSLVQAWETPKELEVPESVMYDSARSVLYVSNISGMPTLKNSKGFISKVNLDGSIRDLYWVAGFNAPKGMGIAGDTLYVTDIDVIHAINISTGAVFQSWRVEGAKFLNDIAIDPKGNVFITDMGTNTIHMIHNGMLDSFFHLDYNRPNGLLMEGDTLLVGTAEGLLKIDTQSRHVVLEIEHQGGIDGIKKIDTGRYLVSDWKGKTQVIEKGKPPIVLLDTSDQKINAADFEYISARNLLLIPTFFDNRVVAYRLQ